MLSPKAQSACQHCGLETAGTPFCCAGCESVFTLLHARGLSHYYEMRDSNPLRPATPVASLEASEDEAADASADEATFYLEGIHCLGCLWLLEKLPELEPGILQAKLDIGGSLLKVQKKAGFPWQQVTRLIRQLGYVPRAAESGDPQRDDLRRQAVRLGVAGFCAGNIMLLAVSLYAGATGPIGRNFQWLSLMLSIPVLSYCAWPMYRAALMPLAKGKISVDLAIVCAIFAGIASSLWSLISGNGEKIYFDSLSMLVFLLLGSRYALNKFRTSLARKPLPAFGNGKFQVEGKGEIPAQEILPGDALQLQAHDTLPVDSVLRSPQAHFDFSLLTGESAPVKLLWGDSIEAGARVLEAGIRFETLRLSADSRLEAILTQLRATQLHRAPTLDFAERIGRWFSVVVLGLAAGLVLFSPSGDSLQRALALVIVTCPCVLAFAVPLAYTRALQQAAKKGLLFRSAEKLEALADAEQVFLDKTGTLTQGNFAVLGWENLSGSESETRAAVMALEAWSAHPAGKAVARYLAAAKTIALPATNITEIEGGVTGEVAGERWAVRRWGEEGQANRVAVLKNDQLRAILVLGDEIRPEAAAVVSELKRLRLKPVLLSGDREGSVAAMAETLCIPRWFSRLTPEGKAEALRAAPRSVMVGDGANDGIAFQAASVGIAVRGAVELSLKNADIALTSVGLTALPAAIQIARRTRRIVRANFAISLAYNLIAGSLAILGFMSPLLAAILMPLSALSVFVFTQLCQREERV